MTSELWVYSANGGDHYQDLSLLDPPVTLILFYTKKTMNGNPCLFLSLQDLCLLEVINDLDSYPVELLSSLPHWMRYRLLNSLPVLDLCRLHRTPVARGVDTEKFWKSLQIPTICDERYPITRPFDVTDSLEIDVQPFHESHEQSYILDLEQRVIEKVDQYSIKESISIPDLDLDFIAIRELCVLKAAFQLLDTQRWTDSSSESYEKEYRALFEWLISVSYSESKSKDERIVSIQHSSTCRVALTGKHTTNVVMPGNHTAQTTALAKYRGVNGNTRLIPHRLLKIYERGDILELFTFLFRNCGLRPSKNVLNLNLLANVVKFVLPDEDRREKFIQLLKESLQNIQILGLTNKLSATFDDGVYGAVMEGVIRDGKKCRLRLFFWKADTLTTSFDIGALSPFFCTHPRDPGLPRYQGLTALELVTPLCIGLRAESTAYLNALLEQQALLEIVRLQLSFKGSRSSNAHKLFDTLGSLFSRPHFQVLIIDHDDYVQTNSSLQLLGGFLMSPCPHEQKLQYNIIDESFLNNKPLFFKMDVKKIASLDLGAETIPQCSINHKTFLTDTDIVFEMLLYFPHLKLKQLNMDVRAYADSGQLHNAALHPDLQVTNLRLAGYNLPVTASDDVRALLKMPSLTRLTASGEYASHYVLALTRGLAEQAKVSSLRFLTLGQRNVKVSCKKSEFIGLFDVIFSLPQLSDLELRIIGDELLDTVEKYLLEIYSSWEHTASGRKVKCIKYIGTHFCIKLIQFFPLSMTTLSDEYLKFTY